jgi:cytochrome c oxidase cbb3-type subunit 3/ubiquinol-cytochrome c reductase cytochrome c subunit
MRILIIALALLGALIACDGDPAANVPDAALSADATLEPDALQPDAAADLGARDAASMADAAPPDAATPDAAVPDATPPDAGLADPGAGLYFEHCAFCHGVDGEGYVSDNANALAHPEFLAVATDAFLHDAIVHGRPGTPMPILGEINEGPLTDADVDLIVAHIRGWQAGQPLDVHDEVIVGEPEAGAPIYAERCADCHGADGQGGEHMSVANPWFLETASDGFIAHAIRLGRPGTPMEPYLDAAGGPLTDGDVANLVALIRAWQVPVEVPMDMDYVPDPENAAINPDGADPDFVRREDRFVAAADIKAALDAGHRIILLDARSRAEFLQLHITGAISLPHFELEMYIDRLPRDVWIIAYCGCPHAVSGRAFDKLAEAGFEHIGVLDEGLWHWRDEGFPVSVGREDAPEE